MVDDVETSVGVPPFDRSPTTNQLIELFAATQPGDLLSYDEIDSALGCTRDAWQHGCIRTARKVLLDRFSIRLDCVPGIGYYHPTDAEIAAGSVKDTSYVGRAAKRKLKAIVSGIKDKTKIPHAKTAQLALAAHVTSTSATKILESTRAVNGELSHGDTLDILRKKL